MDGRGSKDVCMLPVEWVFLLCVHGRDFSNSGYHFGGGGVLVFFW